MQILLHRIYSLLSCAAPWPTIEAPTVDRRTQGLVWSSDRNGGDRQIVVSAKALQRRLAAIVSADVVGYSRMMSADEEGTLARLRKLRETIFDPLVERHEGRVVKLMGDGTLLEFPSVVEAVQCCVEIQREVAARNEGLDDNEVIEFRVGINLGDIIIEDADIHGDGVNVAARLEGLAPPGGICISRAARDQVRDKLDHVLRDLGEVALKNIPRPVRVFQVEFGEVAVAPRLPIPTARPAQTADTDKPSIVVLPFDNMSGDPEQEYFSDGITEDIITDLSKVSGLFVIARNSAFVYKDKTFNVPDACRELGVTFALEGSIRKAGNRVRITAQLIDGSSGGHLWAERYDRDLTDIFEVQDDVTQHIVGALKITLSDTDKTLMGDSGTKNVDAHDCFLRGRELIFGSKRDREIFEQSTAWFRRAIELDPDYAAPYAGLAMAHILDYQNRWSETPERSIHESQRFVDEAIARNDKEPFAHYVAATVAMFHKDYERWAHEADTALTLNPNYAPALNVRGTVHIYEGEPAQAIPYIERAMRLDPAFQQQYLHFLGTAYFVAGDYHTAEALFRDRISTSPTTDLSRAFLASVLGHLDKLDEAREVWRELMEINPGYSHAAHIGRLPFKNPADAEKFGEGLGKAGLTD